MSTETLPALPIRYRVTCDICGERCGKEQGESRRVQEGVLTLKQHALDYQGNPVADGSFKADLCDKCLGGFVPRMNAVIESLQASSGGFVDIVFDGPPSRESGRFVETEAPAGNSIGLGEWVHRPDGYWALRLTPMDLIYAVAAQAVTPSGAHR